MLGYDACGAKVDATLKSLKDNVVLPGHLPALVARLASAAKAGAAEPGDALANAIKQNVVNNVATLKSASPILDAAVTQGKLKVVGGVYRLATGRVEILA